MIICVSAIRKKIVVVERLTVREPIRDRQGRAHSRLEEASCMVNETSGDRQEGRHLAEGDHQTPNEKGDDAVAQQRAQWASTAK